MRRTTKPIKTAQPKRLVNRVVFFVGWVLSPFTFWNDTFVNIPLSYLAANIMIRFVRIDFLMAVLISYWISNILGIAIMYFSGRLIIAGRKELVREAVIFAATVFVYSIIMIVLYRTGVLKPLW